MTREEAIEVLRNTAWFGFDKDREATEEAVDMAIEALTQDSRKVTKESTQDLISRQDIKYHVHLEAIGNGHYEEVEIAYKNDIESLPSAEPNIKCIAQIRIDQDDMEDLVNKTVKKTVDPKTGMWINREKCQVDEDAYEVAICSECGAEITIEYPYDSYCPNCGAGMRGGKNEDSENKVR